MTTQHRDAALSPSEQATIRQLLDADRQRTETRIAVLGHDRDDMVQSAAQSASDDEHDPEGTSTAFERAHIEALLSMRPRRTSSIWTWPSSGCTTARTGSARNAGSASPSSA